MVRIIFTLSFLPMEMLTWITCAGPVAQNVKDQSAKTTAEFNDLANSRQTPDYKAATGQPLTPYHSLFSQLLSWKNPSMSISNSQKSNIRILGANKKRRGYRHCLCRHGHVHFRV